MKLCLISLIALAVPLFAAEKSSKQLAKEAARSTAAFECSHLAFLAKKEELGQKLLKLGYDSGREFLAAAKAGKIQAEDYRREVPIIFNLLSIGPNDDFVLGRLYEALKEDADELATKSLDGETLTRLAEEELSRRNAELLVTPEK